MVRGAQAKTQQERPSGSIRQSSAAGVRVLAVDDHEAFREALRDLVATAPGFVLVGLASSGEEALNEFRRLSPELVLMDVMMPGIGGIAAARVIVHSDPDAAVLLLSVDDPAAHLKGEQLGDGVALLRKQNLSLDELQRVWDRLHD